MINRNFESFYQLIKEESGIRGLKEILAHHKEKYGNKFEIWLHQDLDGVTSALAMIAYLNQYGMELRDAHIIQYGGLEYAIKKAQPDSLAVLVDFAHFKSNFKIATDHHTSQSGTSDVRHAKPSRSNVQTISGEISPRPLFPEGDLELISTVDSANFLKYGLDPTDISNSVFQREGSLTADENRFLMGLVVDPAIAFFIADDGKCSFIRVDYLVPVPTGKPQPLKVGRFAQRFLDSVRQKYPSTPKFTQKEIADFVDEFKAISKLSQGSVSKFLEIVNGNAIAHYYHQDQYTKRRSETLQTSCMKYPECQAYFDVYTQNPQVCSLLIMRSKTEPDKIEGRALVWTLIDGTKFMDRIYYTEQYQVEIFKDYAIKNGWVYKKNQNNKSDEYCLVGPDKVYSGVLAVKLQKWEFELYPYLDTLCYFDDEEKILHNGQDKYKQDYILQQTDGQGGPLTCRNCRGLHYVRCETCFGAGQVWNDDRSPDQPSRVQCPTCEGDGVNRCPECQ